MRNEKFPHAHVHINTRIAPGVEIKAGATISNRVHIGPSCYIGMDTKITGPVTIGREVYIHDRCVLEGPLAIDDHACLRDHVSIVQPLDQDKPKLTTIGAHAFIGLNVRLRAGINIGAHAFIEDGACVEDDVAPNTCVAGAPAVFVGFYPR